ncbi:MAG TPA: hypothetical protein VG276_20295 [Actinomycetes bacterium]|jgi:hypothetical protein|nr:hypothetical protein [Actinomycetes bacterium]
MALSTSIHLLLNSEPDPPEVTARQHPDADLAEIFYLDLRTRDPGYRRADSGHLAISGTPAQLSDLLDRLRAALTAAVAAAELVASDTPATSGPAPAPATTPQPAS